MGDSVGGSLRIPDELGHMPAGVYEKLKKGEYLLDFGRCYACGKIERTEGEDHSYFVDDGKGNKMFVSKECWSKSMGTEIEKHPLVSSKILGKIRVSEEEKAMEAAANFLR